MKQIYEKDLTIQKSKNPLPTVEVDISAIPEKVGGYGKIITKALEAIAANVPNSIATIYVYQGPSVNFAQETWSAFFGVAGEEKSLGAILKEFKNVGIKNVRFSDYIDPRDATRDFHLQNGQVWRPLEPGVWITSPQEKAIINDASGMNLEEGGAIELTDLDDISCFEDQTSAHTAKNNATVAEIRCQIELVFGLPVGSVQLCDPTRKALRGDATIATLWRRWGY